MVPDRYYWGYLPSLLLFFVFVVGNGCHSPYVTEFQDRCREARSLLRDAFDEAGPSFFPAGDSPPSWNLHLTLRRSLPISKPLDLLVEVVQLQEEAAARLRMGGFRRIVGGGMYATMRIEASDAIEELQINVADWYLSGVVVKLNIREFSDAGVFELKRCFALLWLEDVRLELNGNYVFEAKWVQLSE